MTDRATQADSRLHTGPDPIGPSSASRNDHPELSLGDDRQGGGVGGPALHCRALTPTTVFAKRTLRCFRSLGALWVTFVAGSAHAQSWCASEESASLREAIDARRR